MKHLKTPITKEDLTDLKVGETVKISGYIFTGRDTVLPKLVALGNQGKLEDMGISLEGSIIFHTAVSDAGVGPTSSNKVEIENSMVPLSKQGVRLHLGKGAISKETVEGLAEEDSVFAIIPPVSALLGSQTVEKQVIAFPELGMEAMHRLKVVEYTVIIAAAHGQSLY
ncbi:MAG: fumarate hydratase [Clostridium sp.]|nr:fumarate hydratase [Clostridium sp.]